MADRANLCCFLMWHLQGVWKLPLSYTNWKWVTDQIFLKVVNVQDLFGYLCIVCGWHFIHFCVVKMTVFVLTSNMANLLDINSQDILNFTSWLPETLFLSNKDNIVVDNTILWILSQAMDKKLQSEPHFLKIKHCIHKCIS